MDELTLAPLSNATLARLPDGVLRPRYDRAAIGPGIVHVGVGNFHRAHQAWYLHRLMQDGKALDWGIVGGGVRAADAGMRARLAAQDNLTTLIQLDPDEGRVEVTGSMIAFAEVAETGHAPLVAAMADPRIRIVSLTVTEGGYYRDAGGALNADHPDIRHDAAHLDTPRTAFGAMIAALRRRRAAGDAGFTCLSCDNLQGNGDVLQGAVLGLARMQDPALADWIAANTAFPNSMVDCIVPATGPRERAMAAAAGIDDAAPVTHERFRQWVIEDRFPTGRPEWEAAGATLADDVHAYETMKIRLLNAGHQILANAGELLSLDSIADCMAHRDVAALLRTVLSREVAPHVAPVPGRTPQQYLDLISGRFANPLIHDTVRRVAFDGTARHATFVLPTIRDALAAGAPLDGLALTEALWARMCAGTREDGTAIEPNDPHWDARHRNAEAARTHPQIWLAQDEVYGDLADAPRFEQSFSRWLRTIWCDGSAAAIRGYLEAPA
ncbi:Mannitol dehydrogenase [Oceaniovalibus guishaninsula JLT2003]|uniref:Mannitol dehydrogenase n=1 Tax=Oceaniovalibus guishaninsula JLT2003 TaxID=1231392 RepID=K2HJM4_9RHOB|nr:mannitol dehydrogenase family protein [Oceaniovalibus guishaninsula]EKE43184.1 Mannitol dehydrogenase [Oceaniovalibus guishaninsula JLT2003]